MPRHYSHSTKEYQSDSAILPCRNFTINEVLFVYNSTPSFECVTNKHTFAAFSARSTSWEGLLKPLDFSDGSKYCWSARNDCSSPHLRSFPPNSPSEEDIVHSFLDNCPLIIMKPTTQ